MNFLLLTTGRPGPVWIDIPIDVQSFELPEEFLSFINEPLNSSYQSLTQSIFQLKIKLMN